jgi:hypothetical protein
MVPIRILTVDEVIEITRDAQALIATGEPSACSSG